MDWEQFSFDGWP